MKHDLTVERHGVRLRPVRLSDAAFIVQLRQSEHAKGFIGDSPSEVAAEQAWLRDYFERENDYYFIIEKSSDAVSAGTSGVCDISAGVGEWGRWVIMPGVQAAPASMWLTFHAAFDLLGLEMLRALVVESNSRMISIHKKLGSICKGVWPVPRVIGGQTVNLVEFQILKPGWPGISLKLDHFARLAERILPEPCPV